MAEQQKATPEDYALIFETHKVGQRVLDDLITRFARRGGGQKDGITRVLDTFEYQGQRNIIDFIALRIEQSNEVKNESDIQVSVDE